MGMEIHESPAEQLGIIDKWIRFQVNRRCYDAYKKREHNIKKITGKRVEQQMAILEQILKLG